MVNDPLGGRIDFASPYILTGGVVKAFYSYQTNLKENEFRNGQIEFSHFISNCDLDVDFKWSFRSFSFKNTLKAQAQSFESDLNLRRIKLIGGINNLDFQRIETNVAETSFGPLIGIGIWLGRPLYSKANAKVSFYKSSIEYQINIDGGYKRWNWFLKFYKLDEFNELSLGIGRSFYYRIKKRKK